MSDYESYEEAFRDVLTDTSLLEEVADEGGERVVHPYRQDAEGNMHNLALSYDPESGRAAVVQRGVDSETLFTREDLFSEEQVDAIVYIAENGLPDTSEINDAYYPGRESITPEEIPDIFSTELADELEAHSPFDTGHTL
jgi:hypothetical protein